MNKQNLFKTLEERMLTQHTFGSIQKEKAFIAKAADTICSEIDETYYDLVDHLTRLYPVSIHVANDHPVYGIWDRNEGYAYISIQADDGALGYLYQLVNVITRAPSIALKDSKQEYVTSCLNKLSILKSVIKKEIKADSMLLDVIHALYRTDDMREIARSYFRDVFSFTITNDEETLEAVKGFFPKSYDAATKVFKLISNMAHNN